MDLKHELAFCKQMECEVNEHGNYVFSSANGAETFSLPHVLQDYRQYLFEKGIIKDYQSDTYNLKPKST